MQATRPMWGCAAATAIVAAIGLSACGGDSGSGDGDISGEIVSCVEDAGLSVVTDSDINEIEAKQVAAGQEAQIQVGSTEDPESFGQFDVFGIEEDADAWGAKQKDEYGYVSELYGRVGLTTFEDDSAREDLTACAEASA